MRLHFGREGEWLTLVVMVMPAELVVVMRPPAPPAPVPVAVELAELLPMPPLPPAVGLGVV